MVNSEFSELTKSQLLRDMSIIERIHRDYIAPLVNDLNRAVPGYSELGMRDKYLALLKLNEKRAPHGVYLMVDFGSLLSEPDADNGNDRFWNTRCAFFYGESDFPFFYEIELGGTKLYLPLFIQGGTPGIPALAPNIPALGGYQKVYAAALESSDYLAAPLCFRIAMVAELLRHSTTIPHYQACMLSAGFIGTDAIRLERVAIRPLISTETQRFGWNITIRDTAPSNPLMDYATARIRTEKDFEEWFFNGLQPIRSHGSDTLLYASDGKRKRDQAERTKTLIAYIDDYLPSIGYHVGAREERKSGSYLSWKRAQEMFSRDYPEYAYTCSSVQFAKTYRNAKSLREGR